MKKILWLSITVPCQNINHAGGKTFKYYYDNMIKSNEYDIYLIAMNDGFSEDSINAQMKGRQYRIVYRSNLNFDTIKNIESKFNPWNVHGNLLSNYMSSKMINAIYEVKNEGFIPDAVIFEWTQTLMLYKKVSEIFPNARFIASEHDVTYIGYERKCNYFSGLKKMWWSIKYKNEKKIEMEALSKCDMIMVHNPENKEALIKEGLDSCLIDWLVPYYDNLSCCVRKPNCKDILFYGAIGRPENYLSVIWFIEKVMPLLQEMDIRFIVLGGNPPKKLNKYKNERILITGFMPSIKSYFEQSMCFVAPLVLGAGIKVKMLEAFSSGIPVLTNCIGIEGISVNKDTDYYHCETPEEYANAIKSIYYSTNETRGQSVKKYINDKYDLQASFENYILKIKELIQNDNN